MTKGNRHRPGRVMRDFGRASGGALIFSLPMLMTMELWSLGLYLDRFRLLLLVVLTLPLLVLLSRHVGFERTDRWRSDLLDSLIALGVAAVISALVLVLMGVITWDSSADAVIGKLAVQIVPASIGALLAKSQFASNPRDDPGQEDESYWGELFLMAVGALFLGFNTAPTDEILVIAFQMTHGHALALVVLTVAVMHAFVFSVGFAGGTQVSPDEPWWSPFIRMTLPGFAIAFSISLGLLWLFSRTDGMSLDSILMATIVLSLPCAIGAAAARLII